jgi:hypothetical protein
MQCHALYKGVAAGLGTAFADKRKPAISQQLVYMHTTCSELQVFYVKVCTLRH